VVDGSRGASGVSARARSRVAARKRGFDLVVGGILSLLALPVIAVLAVGVAISLRAWPFFVQSRPGWQGRTLTMIKLRTLPTVTPAYMDKHTLGLATMELPKLCALLRRTHLDELPQLFSVVAGQMSLIGPRPALPNDVEPLEAKYESLRRSVRPGCTGLWQLSVAATDTATSAPRFDLFYVSYASLRLDVWTFVRTIGWVLGLVEPIEVADIPHWTLGPGLVNSTLVPASLRPVPLEEVQPSYPANPVTPTYVVRPVITPLSGGEFDGLLAEAVD
jgi:lipopolysaccharide/colanic/teichoic acid biosynthesis glycosyltransferase